MCISVHAWKRKGNYDFLCGTKTGEKAWNEIIINASIIIKKSRYCTPGAPAVRQLLSASRAHHISSSLMDGCMWWFPAGFLHHGDISRAVSKAEARAVGTIIHEVIDGIAPDVTLTLTGGFRRYRVGQCGCFRWNLKNTSCCVNGVNARLSVCSFILSILFLCQRCAFQNVHLRNDVLKLFILATLYVLKYVCNFIWNKTPRTPAPSSL